MLTAVDIHILKIAKAQTEAGLTIEEVDGILSTVAIPEEVVDAPEGDDVAIVPAPASDEGVGLALLRQMTTALDRLEAKEARLAKVEADMEEKTALLARLQGEIADLKTRVESQPAAPAPRPSPWAAYGPYIVGIAIIAGVILTVALVVALFQ
jgi:DNA-binding transcriptional MerR regulator